MNIEQRRVLGYRFLASGLLLLPIGVMIFSLLQVIVMQPEDIALNIVALSASGVFNLFEIIVIMKGWTKESNLMKISFLENGDVNNVPLIAVIVGSVFGTGLCTLGTVVYFLNDKVSARCAMLVILTIASYLLINCIIYFIFLLFFRKREIDLRDFIK